MGKGRAWFSVLGIWAVIVVAVAIGLGIMYAARQEREAVCAEEPKDTKRSGRVSFARSRLTRFFRPGSSLAESENETFEEPEPGPGLLSSRPEQSDQTPPHQTRAASRPPSP